MGLFLFHGGRRHSRPLLGQTRKQPQRFIGTAGHSINGVGGPAAAVYQSRTNKWRTRFRFVSCSPPFPRTVCWRRALFDTSFTHVRFVSTINDVACSFSWILSDGSYGAPTIEPLIVQDLDFIDTTKNGLGVFYDFHPLNGECSRWIIRARE